MAKASAVDDYIAQHPDEVQLVLRRVRSIIGKVLPEAEETVSYGIPAYKCNGRIVVFFAGWKQHWSLYPVTDSVRDALGSALEGYEISKGTVRFPLTKPVPTRLVERIVRSLAKAADRRRQDRESETKPSSGS